MGRILDEKNYIKTGPKERWAFRLVLFSDPADHPTATAYRQVKTSEGWAAPAGEPLYTRTFPRDGFNHRHYANFQSKLARDASYRRRFFAGEVEA